MGGEREDGIFLLLGSFWGLRGIESLLSPTPSTDQGDPGLWKITARLSLGTSLGRHWGYFSKAGSQPQLAHRGEEVTADWNTCMLALSPRFLEMNTRLQPF